MPVLPLTRAATQKTFGTRVEQPLLVTEYYAPLLATVNKLIDLDFSAIVLSVEATRLDGEDYIGDLGEYDSAKMALPKLLEIFPSVYDKASTMRVTVPAPKLKSKS